MNYKRIKIAGGCYFFTVVTYQRNPVLSKPESIVKLRNAFLHVKNKFPFRTDALVVLPDHMHCIWQLPENDFDYSTRWRLIKHFFSIGNTEPVWQPRFWEHFIRNEQDWKNHMDYIHYNPVKHCLVSSPTKWPYSTLNKCIHKGFYEPNWGEGEKPANINDIDCE